MAADDAYSTNEDTSLVVVAPGVMGNDSDVDNSGMTPANAGLSVATPRPLSGPSHFTGDSNVNEGSPYTLNIGAITDPGADIVTDYSINWGDGNTDSVSGDPANTMATHTYADGLNSYTISVSLTDEDGRYADVASLGVTVDNVAPTVTLDPVSDIDENGIATLTGTNTDPGILDTFTLDINWGGPSSPDNTETHIFPASATGTQTFTLTHQYLDDNPTGTSADVYTITASASDGQPAASAGGGLFGVVRGGGKRIRPRACTPSTRPRAYSRSSETPAC